MCETTDEQDDQAGGAMAEWFRADLTIRTNPKFRTLGAALGIPVEFQRSAALGFVMSVYANVVEHCPDGDVSRISADVFEEWAGWRGDSGKFYTEFRTLFVTNGAITGWAEREAKLIESEARRKQHDRDRKARETTARARNSSGTDTEFRDISSGNPAEEMGDGTVRTASLHTARERFIDAIKSSGRRVAWQSRFNGWEQGLDFPGGCTADDIERALADYELNGDDQRAPNAAHVRAHVVRIVKERKAAESGAVSNGNGARRIANVEAMALWGRVLSTIAGTPWRFLPRETFTDGEWLPISDIGGLRAIAEMTDHERPFMEKRFVAAYEKATAAFGAVK